MVKTKEELSEIVFKYLRSHGGMDLDPEMRFQEALPEYQLEIKNILGEVIRDNQTGWDVYTAMWCLLYYFPDKSFETNTLYILLQDLMTEENPDVSHMRHIAKRLMEHISGVQII